MSEFKQSKVSVPINAKASKIKLLLFDVDGVLTDGKILLTPTAPRASSSTSRTARGSSGRSGPG